MKRFVVFFCSIFLVVSSLNALDLEKTYGIFKIVMHEKAGTFSLYATDGATGKFMPVLSTIDNSSGTQFYLRVGTSVYSLTPKSGVKIEQVLDETQARIDYEVAGKFHLITTFSFFSSAENELADIIQMDFEIQNLSAVTNGFSFKAIFDTCLGEGALRHFSTATRISVNEEMTFPVMSADKWIRSSDGFTSIQFLLDGADVTSPKLVTVANRDILLTRTWEPAFVNGRGFNSLFSYNNSAVGVHWDTNRLAAGKNMKIRFYISAGVAEMVPVDLSAHLFAMKQNFVQSIQSEADADATEAELDESAVSDSQAVVGAEQVESSQPATSQPVIEQPVAAEPAGEQTAVKNPVESPAKKIEKQPSEQIDAEYMQSLLDRIAELEKNPEAANQDEIDTLNAELDLILQQVKKE